MSPPIWFVGGEKGGIGKSTCANLLIDFACTRLERPVLVVETDSVNPDVGRTFYQKDIDNVVMVPQRIDTTNDWIALGDVIEDNSDHLVVINGAAQILEGLRVGRHVIQAMDRIDREWVTWWTLGPELDSVDLLARFHEMISGGAEMPHRHRLIVIENAGRSDERAFRVWRASRLYSDYRDAGVPIVSVSHLATDVVDELRTRAWSVAEAREKLRFARRVELERWRNAAHTSIAGVLGNG